MVVMVEYMFVSAATALLWWVAPEGLIERRNDSAFLLFLTLTINIPPYSHFLSQTRPMLPKGGSDAVLKRAQVRRVAEMVNSGIQPLQNLSQMAKITTESGGAYDGKKFGKDAIVKYVLDKREKLGEVVFLLLFFVCCLLVWFISRSVSFSCS